jgi:hypothetical protein
MNHINAVLDCNPNDIILCKISADRCQTLADLICFIGLQRCQSVSYGTTRFCRSIYLLTVSRHPIFVGVDSNGVHSKLMSRTEHTDRDFLHPLN